MCAVSWGRKEIIGKNLLPFSIHPFIHFHKYNPRSECLKHICLHIIILGQIIFVCLFKARHSSLDYLCRRCGRCRRFFFLFAQEVDDKKEREKKKIKFWGSLKFWTFRKVRKWEAAEASALWMRKGWQRKLLSEQQPERRKKIWNEEKCFGEEDK